MGQFKKMHLSGHGAKHETYARSLGKLAKILVGHLASYIGEKNIFTFADENIFRDPIITTFNLHS
jgi:hypothetical protein